MLCKIFQLFGWRVVSIEDNGLKSVELFSFADLSNLKTADLYNRKGLFVDEFLDKHIVNSYKYSLDTMHRTVIFQFINSRLTNFDYLAAIIEHYRNQKVKFKVVVHENGFAREFFSHFNIVENIIFLPNFRLAVLPHLPNDVLIRSLRIFKTNFSKLSVEKIKKPFQFDKEFKDNAKILFFPHKGITYGSAFAKDYYYGLLKVKPEAVMHVEFRLDILSVNQQNQVVAGYKEKGLQFFALSDVPLFYFLLAIVKHPHKIIGFIKPFNVNKLRMIGFTTGLYTCAWALFLRKIFPNAEKALVGYDVLFPKYISGAMQLAGIETHAIQERMTLIRTNNYQVSADYYYTWSEDCSERIRSKKSSRVDHVQVIQPPRSKLIKVPQLTSSSTIVCFCNHPLTTEEDWRKSFLQHPAVVEEFIELVLYLASAFKQFSFIIRFKNLNIFDCTKLDECVKKRGG